MENIRKQGQPTIVPMSLRDAAVALIENSRNLEKASVTDAAYLAGYIARYIETADVPKHSA